MKDISNILCACKHGLETGAFDTAFIEAHLEFAFHEMTLVNNTFDEIAKLQNRVAPILSERRHIHQQTKGEICPHIRILESVCEYDYDVECCGIKGSCEDWK